MNAPDVIGYVTGWREFELTNSGHLMSTGIGKWVWSDEETMCCVKDDDHATPQEECGCGLYAYHDAESVDSDNSRLVFYRSDGDYIAALIQAWGEIVVHCDGFRAQHARIAALIVPPEWAEKAPIRRMVGNYEARLVASKEKAIEIAGEYGFPVPEEMRPEDEPKEDDALRDWIKGQRTATAGVGSYHYLTLPGYAGFAYEVQPPSSPSRIAHIKRRLFGSGGAS